MTSHDPVAVTSRSFSRHPVLRRELLERYEDVTFNDEGASLRGDALVEFLRGKVKAITALEPIDDELLSQLPELQVISKVGVGIDMIDLAAIERHGVRLSWTPGTNSRSVAELVIALAIALSRRLPEAMADAIAGEWRQRKGRTISGRTFGILGFGRVGQDVARLAGAFGCELLAHDTDVPDEAFEELDVSRVKLDELLARAEILSVHLPLTDSTANLLNAERLRRLPPGALLVNTARGGLVDERALFELLMSGHLGGAAFDVFAREPPENRELLALPNFIATPHIGGSTEEAILAMGRAAIAGLDNSAPTDSLRE